MHAIRARISRIVRVFVLCVWYLPIGLYVIWLIYNFAQVAASEDFKKKKKLIFLLWVAVFWVGYVCAAFLAFVAADFAFSAILATALDNRGSAVWALQVYYFHGALSPHRGRGRFVC